MPNVREPPPEIGAVVEWEPLAEPFHAIAIRESSRQNCAISKARTVACWGAPAVDSNADAALQANRATPHRIRGLVDVIDVAMMHGWICVARKTGDGGCYRMDSSSTSSSAPLAPGPFAQLAVDEAYRICARQRDGTVTCEPYDTSTIRGATDLSCGVGCCAVTPEGLVCYGRNASLGFTGKATLMSATADVVDVAVGTQELVMMTKTGRARWCGQRDRQIDKARAVLVFESQPCAIDAEDRLQCGSLKPTRPVADIVDASDDCTVRRDGSVWCRGDNRHGELGDGKPILATLPTRVPGTGRVVDVRVSYNAVCALRDDGTTKCWGDAARSTPRAVALGTSLVDAHCVLTSDREVVCPTEPSGAHVVLEQGATVTSIAVDLHRKVCRVDANKTLHCAASPTGSWRQLRTNVVEALPLSSGFCARLVDGRIECMPSKYIAKTHTHEMGRLVRVPQLEDAIQLATSDYYACVRRKSGAVACWRADGETQPPPTDLVAVRDPTWIAGGEASSFCVIVAGRIECWGQTDEGVLGNGTIPPLEPGRSYTQPAEPPWQ